MAGIACKFPLGVYAVLHASSAWVVVVEWMNVRALLQPRHNGFLASIVLQSMMRKAHDMNVSQVGQGTLG